MLIRVSNIAFNDIYKLQFVEEKCAQLSEETRLCNACFPARAS